MKTTYGNRSESGQITKLEAFDATRDGIDDGLIGVSIGRSWVPACKSESWVSAEVTPSVTTMLFS